MFYDIMKFIAEAFKKIYTTTDMSFKDIYSITDKYHENNMINLFPFNDLLTFHYVPFFIIRKYDSYIDINFLLRQIVKRHEDGLYEDRYLNVIFTYKNAIDWGFATYTLKIFCLEDDYEFIHFLSKYVNFYILRLFDNFDEEYFMNYIKHDTLLYEDYLLTFKGF